MLYCTRAGVHVDRCASAWLIRRFLDPAAEFAFVTDGRPAHGAIPFDMPGVAWGHHHGRCTFETLLALHGLSDPVLLEIGRIIHGADITSDADETLESAGIDLLFRGLRLISETDAETFQRGMLVMDALYAAVRERLPHSAKESDG